MTHLHDLRCRAAPSDARRWCGSSAHWPTKRSRKHGGHFHHKSHMAAHHDEYRCAAVHTKFLCDGSRRIARNRPGLGQSRPKFGPIGPQLADTVNTFVRSAGTTHTVAIIHMEWVSTHAVQQRHDQ